MKSLTFILLLFFCTSLTLASLQRYIVKGRLLCGKVPERKVQVKLIDVGKIFVTKIVM